MRGIDQFHHGCCQGSDEFAHRAAKGAEAKLLVLHPPLKRDWEMEYTQWDYDNCVWFPRRDYLPRDRDIVECSKRLLALPKGPEEFRGSGTWYTIRYAVKAQIPVYICHPDGKVEAR